MLFKKLRRHRWIASERRKLKKSIEQAFPLKIIIGAGTTGYQGWIKTDFPFFDITKSDQWDYLFSNNQPVAILCEHVLEHFTESDNKKILELAYSHLASNGQIRVAVPDKNHPNSHYIECTRPGGSGPGAKDHKSFWDYKRYGSLFQDIGFKVVAQEYCTENHEIITNKYSLENGTVVRSLSYGHKSQIKDYSSLIVDGVKQ